MPDALGSRSLTRPAPVAGVSIPDPIDAFARALEEAVREKGLTDLALTRKAPQR